MGSICNEVDGSEPIFTQLAVTLFYYPQTKLREGNVFTPVCDSVHKVGVCGERGMYSEGVCIAKGGMRGEGGVHGMGHVWQGVCAWRGGGRACRRDGH